MEALHKIEEIIENAIDDFSSKWKSHIEKDSGITEYAHEITNIIETETETAQLQADNTQNCEAGCKVYTGGERRHDKHCVFYPESFTKMYDELQADKAELLEALQDIQDELENGDTPHVYKIEELIQKHKQ